jgi:hypothetical protein
LANGGKSKSEFNSAFTAEPDSAVLLRSRPDGPSRSTAARSPAASRGTRPITRRTGSSARTHRARSIAVTARTRQEAFAVAPCAGSIRNRPVELLNTDAVQRGALPEYLVKERMEVNTAGSVVAMFNILPSRRKWPEERTVGKFGQRNFAVIAHVVASYGPKYVGGVINSQRVDERWFFTFTRCPVTAPC